MNKKTIIFMGGIFVPNWLSKSAWLWNKSYWSDYNCLWLTSKIPYSDLMAERELDRLQRMFDKHPGAVFAGHSLGAWWAANLACRKNCQIGKLILWTPLSDASQYPIFNVTNRFNPCKQIPNSPLIGPSKTLVAYATNDLIVPHHYHAYQLLTHFKGMSYSLNGGHLYQTNHERAIEYMKDWIEIP